MSLSRLLLVTDRPLFHDARVELDHRLAIACAPPLSEWSTLSLGTAHPDPLTPSEALAGGAMLRRELAGFDGLVVCAGAHALRWLLGRDVNPDAVHGLVHYSERGKCLVLPIVHPSSALRQPGLYASAFVDDIRAIAHAIADLDNDELTVHEVRTPNTSAPVAGRLGPFMGCDTEGYVEAPECVSWSIGGQASVMTPDDIASLPAGWRWVYPPSFHNATHDLRVLEAMGVSVGEFEDTMLMAYLLNEHVQGLKANAYRYCGLRLDDYDSLIAPLDEARCVVALQSYVRRWSNALRRVERLKGKRKAEAKRGIPKAVGAVQRMLLNPTEDSTRARWSRSVFAPAVPLPKPTTWADLPLDVGAHYAKADAIAHEALCHAFLPRIRAEKLEQAYAIDKAALPMVARMETVGVQVDVRRLQALSVELSEDYARVEREIFEVLGERLNPKASEDVSEMLFGKLRVTPTMLTKSGAYYTTQDKYLLARKHEHAVIPLILEGRETWKMKSAYCDRLPALVSRNGRYHPDFAYTRTASGRLAETILLLIPKHSPKWGKKIRSCFHAAPGRVLVSVDLSQIEMRTMADNSGDDVLLGVYQRNEDVHADTAWRYLGAPKGKANQDESLHRLPAKTFNFGILMGMTEFGLIDQLHAHGQTHWQIDPCTPEETAAGKLSTRTFRAEWFAGHPGVAAYVDRKKREARRTGAVRDMWGAKVRLDAIDCTDERRVREAERQAHAIPIQAGADRISKQWMAHVWREVILPARGTYYCEPWCRAHDDLILEVDEARADEVKAMLLQLVPQVLCVPVQAEAKIGANWGALKG